MKPAVTIPDYRRLFYLLTIVSCLFTTKAFTQPTPEVIGESTVCQGETYYYYTPFDANNSYIWSVSTGGTIISPPNEHTVYIQWTGPTNSPQWLQVSETDSNNVSVIEQVPIYIASNILSCENNVNISLDQTGIAEITPQILLDGNYISYDNFQVMLSHSNGIQFGNIVTCGNIGQTIIGKVTDECTGNSCWSTLNVEDKKAPQWDCPTVAVEIPCDTDIDDYPYPPVEDNCDTDISVSLTGIQIDNSDICQGVTITRHWVASDDYDNEAYCVQVLYIDPAQDVVFPEDRVWLCDHYAEYPNLTDPTTYTDSLHTTGSGVPIGATGPYCPYSFTNHDDTLNTCGNTIKIIRTWTVLNWCTQQVITEDINGDDNEQIIKILDLNKPTITVPQVTLSITEPGASAVMCRSLDLLPAPTVSDTCSAVTVKIYTEIGEAVYVNGVDGSSGGYVPSPGLGLGEHTITYKAIDDCGNVTELLVTATVIDDEAPVAICDEITGTSLDQFGSSLVYAQTFDDGSYDNCCIGQMLVRRMEDPETDFAPSVILNCSDTVAMVVFRVYDCFDNYAECMVQVEVEDKLPPICIAPQNKTVSCVDLPPDIDEDWVTSFGEAIAVDNCDATIIEHNFHADIDACGNGHITRYFNAVDGQGNMNLAACQQTINVTPVSDWLINFPPNWSGDCGDSITSIDLIYGEFGCEQLAYSYSDQYFNTTVDSVCFKLVRTWKVINWCNYDPNEDPIKIPTHPLGAIVDEEDYNNFGSYEYQQIIMIQDVAPPELSAPFDYFFCTGDTACATGPAFLPIQIDGECSSDIEIVHLIDLFKNNTYEVNGMGFFDGSLPIGIHRVRYIVEDGCGNDSEIVFDFEIKDCKKPSPVCTNGLIVEIMQTGMVEICAEDLLEYATDNCPGDLQVSFSFDLDSVCVVLDCDDLGQVPVEIWVTDAAGNADYCDNYIILQDNMDHCSGQPLVGFINTHDNNEPVEDVTVHLNNSMMNEMYVTPGTGMFEFENLPLGNDYTITPEKTDDPLNGVTTFDLVVMSRHILGIQILDSPYQLIAADINNSSSVTTFDMVELRKLILHINDDFPNNTSWRFVDKAYQFPNPNDPWQETFPEIINLNNLSATTDDADFVAVKIGDVNGSAVPNNNFGGGIDERSGGMLKFNTLDNYVAAGETVNILLTAENFTDVYGFQFTIDFDVEKLEFVSVLPTEMTDEENYGLSLLEEGAVTALWFETHMVTLDEDAPIISLLFEVNSGCNLADVINISSRFTPAEAYIGETMDAWDIELGFDSQVTAANDLLQDEFALYQNIPNPFTEKTTIGFDLPNNGDANLTIYDTAGRIVQSVEGNYNKGYNEIILSGKDLPKNGILFYKIEFEGKSAVRQMTVID